MKPDWSVVCWESSFDCVTEPSEELVKETADPREHCPVCVEGLLHELGVDSGEPRSHTRQELLEPHPESEAQNALLSEIAQMRVLAAFDNRDARKDLLGEPDVNVLARSESFEERRFQREPCDNARLDV